MQAGRGGAPAHGTMMHLSPCDKENALQQFDYKQVTIELEDTNLCVMYHGNNGSVNVDTIILKSCD
jgi:hypothetical protein